MMMHTLYTLKRTPIRRDIKYGIGKRVGTKVYMHRMYVSVLMCRANFEEYTQHLPKDFGYTTVVFNETTGALRFDEAPDFNTAREPHPGITYTVTEDGKVTRRVVNQIWHHKWLWVTKGYPRFDVEASWKWSEKWLAKVAEVASGQPGKWSQQLKKYGV